MFLSLGAAAAWAVLVPGMRRLGLPVRGAAVVVLVCLPAGIAGGRIGQALLHPGLAGSTILFGWPAGLAAAALLARMRGWSAPALLEALAPAAALAQALGRIGCFFGGHCFGRATAAWTGVAARPGGPRLHPAQLYESVAMALVFAWLWGRRESAQRPGRSMAWLLLIFGGQRFLLEFLRHPPGSPPVAEHYAALGLAALGAAGLFLTPSAAPAPPASAPRARREEG